MLKRFSSLILGLVVGSSVLAGTARPGNEHVCKMAGMEMMDHGTMAAARRDHGTMDHDAMDDGTMDHATMDHGMETMPGMETMQCCKKHATRSVPGESGSLGQCCVNIPQETGSSGTTLNLSRPSFSVAVIQPAIVQSPLAAPKPYECPYSTEVFLPNLQASYLRNLSFLI